jgi:hypothetical protein
MRKARLLVVVDLDEVPGTMHTVESAQQVTQNVLFQRMSHYNPVVSLAPAPEYNSADAQPATNTEGINAA